MSGYETSIPVYTPARTVLFFRVNAGMLSYQLAGLRETMDCSLRIGLICVTGRRFAWNRRARAAQIAAVARVADATLATATMAFRAPCPIVCIFSAMHPCE